MHNRTMQDWDDIRFYLALVRTGSTTGAAKLLAVNHSTVSRRIAQLEERIGARLFDRLASGAVPTAAGAALVAVAEQVERKATEFSRGASAEDARLAGRLVVTAPPLLANHVLMPMVAEFARRHPDIELELVASDQLSSLTRHEADIAIRATAAPQDTLMGHRLIANENGLYCSQGFLDRRGLDATKAAQCDDLDWIWIDQSKGSPPWTKRYFPRGRALAKVDGKSTGLAAARAGMGVVELPLMVGRVIADLVLLPGLQAPSDKDVWVLYHRDFRRTARVRAFVVEVRNQFRALGPLEPKRGNEEELA
ncbi:Transcriptional regulatory protein [Devosia sp. LC5]|nr:Transcriptional regulatory protein [Devosia sp. LC5]